MRILIIEDEPKLAAFVQQGLEENGYQTEVVYDGLMGKRMAQTQSFDLVVLDVIIPHLNGLELCAWLKAEKPQLPVLMLTALGTTEDKVSGFDAGADDYLVKPFEFKELLVRIRALTRRSSAELKQSNQLVVGDLTLDLDKKIAVRNNQTISLTAKEFALLEYLMRNRGRVVSRVDIAEKVWDITFDTGTNVVDVYVNLLRKKIDRNFDHKLIQTRIGMGYILQD
ncbi:MAG: response regulator transcription factor [Flavobacteriales bacterium]|nr:response regulator transcription factor [Flavobacteriales bacterium]MCB9449257.1 response regulator transcription factor [Flavobacteriales bacterium]